MIDREKVIKELEERIKVAEECMGNPMFTPDAIRTIVALLKEQEAVEPVLDSFLHKRCPSCGALLIGKFCHECGQAVKWNGYF